MYSSLNRHDRMMQRRFCRGAITKAVSTPLPFLKFSSNQTYVDDGIYFLEILPNMDDIPAIVAGLLRKLLTIRFLPDLYP